MTTLRILLDRILDADIELVVDRLANAAAIFSLSIAVIVAFAAAIAGGWSVWMSSPKWATRPRPVHVADTA